VSLLPAAVAAQEGLVVRLPPFEELFGRSKADAEDSVPLKYDNDNLQSNQASDTGNIVREEAGDTCKTSLFVLLH
jgi:hypothetical protein